MVIQSLIKSHEKSPTFARRKRDKADVEAQMEMGAVLHNLLDEIQAQVPLTQEAGMLGPWALEKVF